MDSFLRYVERGLDGVGVIALYNALIIATGSTHPTSFAWSVGIALAAIVVSAIIAVERKARWGAE